MSTPHDPHHNQPNQFPAGPHPQGSVPPQGYGVPQSPGAPQGHTPQPGYGHQPGGHPGQPEQPQKKKNLPLIIGAAVVALAVLGLGIAAALGAFGKKDEATPATQGGGEAGDSAPEAPQTPKAIVEAYLEALSKGDAKAALALASTSGVSDSSLLTDEVLKDSLSRAPMTEIKVSEPGGTEYSPTVKVSYKLGDQAVEDEYTISTHDKKINNPTSDLNLYGVDKAKPLVNGVEAKSEHPAVFPGSYAVTSGNEYLEVEGELPILKKSSKDYDSVTLKLKVSQAGIDMYRSKVIPEAEACLASKDLDPGCNMVLSDTLDNGTKLSEGSITRSQDAEGQDKLKNVVPEPGYQVPTIISSKDFGSFKVSATCTKPDGASGECSVFGFGNNGLSWPSASIDLTDPELKVIWEYK
ncbi:MAG: hypothetical protein Q4D96_11630 [Propionibacteriaceae bacterium]|nr:hypothetical protein [Propionibacteriaceae bacterium]